MKKTFGLILSAAIVAIPAVAYAGKGSGPGCTDGCGAGGKKYSTLEKGGYVSFNGTGTDTAGNTGTYAQGGQLYGSDSSGAVNGTAGGGNNIAGGGVNGGVAGGGLINP